MLRSAWPRRGRVTAPDPSAAELALELEVGQLDLRFPQTYAQSRPDRATAKVQTPAFLAVAYSRDFSVGYRADAYFVAVRDGRVEVEGDGFGGKQTVKKGERQVVRQAGEDAVEAVAPKDPTKKRTKPKRKPKANRNSRVTQRLKAAPGLLASPKPVAPIRSSSEGETSVQVLSEPEDTIRVMWSRAKAAYYEQNKIEDAIELSEQIVRLAGRRQEAYLAQELICQAHIAGKRPNRAGQGLQTPAGLEQRGAGSRYP